MLSVAGANYHACNNLSLGEGQSNHDTVSPEYCTVLTMRAYENEADM